MEFALLPMLQEKGLRAEIEVLRPGYVLKGGGLIRLKVGPAKTLKPLTLARGGTSVTLRGAALSSHLEDKKVSERMVGTCLRITPFTLLMPYS